MYSGGNPRNSIYYLRVGEGFANYLPFSVCNGGKVAMRDQDLSGANCALFVVESQRAPDADVPRADDRLRPPLEPPQKCFSLLFGLSFGFLCGRGWSALRESLEDGVWHDEGFLSCCGQSVTPACVT